MNLDEATLTDLLPALRSGALSCAALTQHYLSRIARLNPSLNAVLEINADALAIAAALDAKRARGEALGPLHGAPILLKDNINTGDATHTTAGSVALKDHYAPRDAHITARLREAGAVILGKANMTEFANAMADDMPNGYSSLGGQVVSLNERVTDPSGSSTGSAVAVMAGLCAAAIGTETCGSIVSPAWHAGIVGLKPTAGLVSREGIIPISRTLDTAGPMARTARDARLLLQAMAGPDARDAATLAQPAGCLADPGPLSLQGQRIGVSRSFIYESEEGPEAARMALDLLPELEAAGAVMVDADIPESGGEWANLGVVFDAIFELEMRASMDAYFQAQGERTTLADLIACNEAHAEVALRYGQAHLLRAQAASGRLTEPRYLAALAARQRWIARLDALFDEAHIDVLLSAVPLMHGPVLGFPAMTLPLGLNSEGRPVGCYWLARRYADMRLLRIGEAVGLMERQG